MDINSTALDLEAAIIRKPLTIGSIATITDGAALMSLAASSDSFLTTEAAANSNYLLVLDRDRLIGIVTAHDLVQQIATPRNMADLKIADVMVSPVITLRASEFTDLSVPLDLFRQHHISHLPLVDDRGAVTGLLTKEGLLQLLNRELEINVVRHNAELEASQRFIQKIADSSPNILYLYDLQEQRNVYANQEIAEILGYTPAEILAMGKDFISTVMHPDDRSRLLPGYFDQLNNGQEGEIFEFEYRMRHANGEWRWLYSREAVFSRDATGRIKQAIGTAQDITERKRLEKQQARLISILEASTDYIGMSDAAGNVLWSNKRGEDFFERQNNTTSEPPSFSDRYHFSIHHPPWALEVVKQQGLPTASATGSWLGETALLDSQGQEIPVSQLILSHKSPQGEVEFFSTIIRDIRASKEYEQRLERSNTELLNATHLKDEFLATMSHELRTPLNAILGMSESLQEEVYGTLNDRQQRSIATINLSGNQLLALINNILDFSRISAGDLTLEITPVLITQLVESSLPVVQPQAQQKNIQLTIHAQAGLEKIAVDERRMRQVLVNLLDNAVKFTPDDGQVELNVYLSDERFLCFSITDNGIGIAQDKLEKLFQPFVQIDGALNRQYEGTGLGLALVKQIVALHGGDVQVKSEQGQGSCFTVKLPYVRSKTS